MIENKLLPRHSFGGYIFDIARRDPCRSLKLFESLVEALLALELQAFCESVPGISQFVFRWIAAGRGGRTLRTGQQHGVRLVRAEAKRCERQHRGKQYPQTHAQIVTGKSLSRVSSRLQSEHAFGGIVFRGAGARSIWLLRGPAGHPTAALSPRFTRRARL